MARKQTVVIVECRYCGARAGRSCTSVYGGATRAHASRRKDARAKLIEDGLGMQASKCARTDCGLHVVRPGKIACYECPKDEQWEKGVFGTDERYVRASRRD